MRSSQPPSTEPCVIADGYGIFVATGGSASAAGTEAAPVDSITTALTLAQSASKHLIFVCGGGYNGAVSIASTLSLDVKIYGGMSCPSAVGGDGGAAWTYTGAATMVSSGSNHPALTVSGTTHAITIEDVGFVAGDAVNAGDSSIAGWIANASGVTFKRAAFRAGNGVSQPVAGMASENHYAGTLGGGTPSGTTGAPPNPCACPDGTTSSLGAGGGTGGIGAARVAETACPHRWRRQCPEVSTAWGGRPRVGRSAKMVIRVRTGAAEVLERERRFTERFRLLGGRRLRARTVRSEIRVRVAVVVAEASAPTLSAVLAGLVAGAAEVGVKPALAVDRVSRLSSLRRR